MLRIDNIRQRAERYGFDPQYIDPDQAAIDGIVYAATKTLPGGYLDLAVLQTPQGLTIDYQFQPNGKTTQRSDRSAH